MLVTAKHGAAAHVEQVMRAYRKADLAGLLEASLLEARPLEARPLRLSAQASAEVSYKLRYATS
ncbi:MAG: hypothetical protein CSA65_08030 [Proteobacteria bacterium]|nr:MAG: hypothetical protein CSA65_08030 [Pseudomonadota bacterium]